MPTLLQIDSSARGDISISRALTQAFVESWKQAHPQEEIITRDLAAEGVPYIDADWTAGAFSFQQPTPEQSRALALSDVYIAELKRADHYLFGVPMYNFGVPAVFKAYIDQITRVGQTVSLAPDGTAKGLLCGKKATVILSCGSTYGVGSLLAPCNFVEPYLRTIFGFLGVSEMRFFTADKAGDVTFGRVSREDYLAPLLTEVRTLAMTF